MGAVRQLVDELRRRGVTVHEWPGWDGRGNADGGVGPRVTQIEPMGVVIHHTGSPYGSGYTGLVSSTRSDLLGGALCNFSGNDDGSLTVIASGLAWHAGPGVGPSLGRVLSRIPNIRNRMNRVTVGLEIVYPGDQPMRKEQYKTALVFARTVADLFADGDVECVRAHAETNGNTPGGSGKWDPGYANGKTIDMAAFRRDATALTGGDDMPSVDEVWRKGIYTQDMKDNGIPSNEAWAVLGGILARTEIIRNELDALQKSTAPAAGQPAVNVDPAEVAAALAGDPKFVDALAGATAKRIADELDRRTRDDDPATGPVS